MVGCSVFFAVGVGGDAVSQRLVMFLLFVAIGASAAVVSVDVSVDVSVVVLAVVVVFGCCWWCCC